MSHSRFRCLGLFAVLTACLWASSLDAQPPGPKKGKGPKGPAADAEILTVRGTVREFTTAPKGERDGVMLTDGTWVHWPPYLADRFTNILAAGDKVKVIGWMETGKKGDTKLEVSSLTNLSTNQTRETDAFPPSVIGARAGFASGSANALTVSGTVREFTSAPKGEVDGFILSDGRWVHWPPHMADRFTAVVAKGDRVRAVGFVDTGPKGDTKLEVSTLTNLRTNRSADNPDQPLPAGVGRVQPGKAGSIEQRLQSLEDRMDQIIQEIRRLRNKN